MNWETFNKYVNLKAIGIFVLVALIFIAILFTVCNKNRDILIEKFDYPTVLANNADFPTFNQDESKIYYFDKSTKKFVQVDLAKNKSTDLLNKTFDGLYSINWSHSGEMAIANTSITKEIANVPDYESTQYITSSTLVDLKNGTTTKMPQALDRVVWSPDNKMIAYALPSDDTFNNYSIYIANNDGTNPRLINTTNPNGADLKIDWSKQNELLVLKPYFNPPETPDMTEREKMSIFYRFDLTNNSLTNISTSGNQITDFSASPNGENIITVSEDENGLGIIQGLKPEIKTEKLPFISFSSTYWAKDSSEIYSMADNTTAKDKPNLAFSVLNLSTLNVNNMDFFSFKTNETIPRYVDQLLISAKKQAAYFVADGALYELTFKKSTN